MSIEEGLKSLDLEYYYEDFWRNNANANFWGYPICGEKPWTLFGIIGFYLTFVLWLGPTWMKHNPPFEMQRLITYYNLVSNHIRVI